MQIVDALGDVSHRTVFEIGPGKGVLTSMLAKRARRLIAVELDRVLAAQLRMEFGQTRNVEIIEGDVLAVDFNTVFGPRPGTTRTEEEVDRARHCGRKYSLLHHFRHTVASV